VSSPERIVPDETEPGIVALHRKRYEFAQPYCRGRDVLDAGCGVGYGTALLAADARSVVGVDLDPDAIAYARCRYGAANVEYRVGDMTALELDTGSVDVVCAFETVEHLDEPERFVAEARRVLRDGGLLLASTPHVKRTNARPENPHHSREYSPRDFDALLRERFGTVELLGQRRRQTGRHRAMQRLDVLGLRKRMPFLRGIGKAVTGTAAMADVSSVEIEITPELSGATELIAVCRT
jgi:2-polyprenyl-3-methyl-5-hydroxy-6-metoxy-1,4-benzoquinol methylase